MAALAAKGCRPTEITWEPIGPMVEMSGYSGGWLVLAEPMNPVVRDSRDALGYNTDEVIDYIERYFPDHSGEVQP